MPDPQLLTTFTQFGVAGLIAWMWLTERRAASTREQQLTQAHDRITQQRAQLDALIDLVRDNTRAVTALENAQSRLVVLLDRLSSPPRAQSSQDPRAPAA